MAKSVGKRENKSISIKDLMRVFIRNSNLKKGISQLDVEKSWAKLMGQGVVSYTDSIVLQDKTLIVRLSSSVLREELSYGSEKIIKMINEEMGEELIDKLILA